MSELSKELLNHEQQICRACGLCCDGTLFMQAHLSPGERVQMPEGILKNSDSTGKQDYFNLPCSYFAGKCMIYESRRPEVCSLYRCQLLFDFTDGKIKFEETFKIIREAIKIKNDIGKKYQFISGLGLPPSFRKLRIELEKLLKEIPEKKQGNNENDMLNARCNIFEALLLKHFRSAQDFDRMMIT